MYNKELKGKRDINLIKILAFPVSMQFSVYRFEVSVQTLFLTSKKLVNALTKVYALKHMLLLLMRTGSTTHICFQC